jgi:hypothetical protein
MEKKIDKDERVVVTLHIKKRQEDESYYWAEVISGIVGVKQVHCKAEIHKQRVPLNE